MDELYKRLSVRLYDAMEHVGASEEMRQLHQSTAEQLEITCTMRSHMTDHNNLAYVFGSFMEGTTTPGLHPDIDSLWCDGNRPVHENIADARTRMAFLMVGDANTRPGYVKLQVLDNGVPMTVEHWDIDDTVDSDRSGRLCMRHISEASCERNGPADTMSTFAFSSDRVISFRCMSIPRFADEWSNQIRKFNWPSRQMIDRMTSSGCFVVGVGHPASDEKHIEWRLSFSLQEREMMLSFNPTQHKCYILLKMVKNDIIGRTIGKCVSSYHLKTCMLYLIQNTRARIWKPTNLFLCLSLCLKTLLKWVKCGYCPNYFIKEENMFDRDVHRQVKMQLSYLLDKIIQAGPRILLCIDCDKINQLLIHPERLPDFVDVVEHHRVLMCDASYQFEMIFRRSFLSCCMKNEDSASTCLFLNRQLQFVQNDSLLNGKPDNYNCKILSRIEKYIHSKLGACYASQAFNVEEPAIKCGLLNIAETHFQQGRYCDMTSSRLIYASLLYTTEQYDRCVRLLEEIEAENGYHVVSSCSCDLRGDHTKRPSSYANTASCVIFLPSNRNITPAPLLPEMYRSVNTPPGSRDEKKHFWFDCAAVDGKIYLHFLKYLAYSKLDQHVYQKQHKMYAIVNMLWLIDVDPNLGHSDTALNLIGWIYVQENIIVRGIMCFKKSWKTRPIHNAAKWHLAIAVYKHIRGLSQNRS